MIQIVKCLTAQLSTPVSIFQEKIQTSYWLVLECRFCPFAYCSSPIGSCQPVSCDLPLRSTSFKMWTRAKARSLTASNRPSPAGTSGLIPLGLIIPVDQDSAPSNSSLIANSLRFPSTDSLSSGDFWLPNEVQDISSGEEYYEEKPQVKLESRSSPASISPQSSTKYK